MIAIGLTVVSSPMQTLLKPDSRERSAGLKTRTDISIFIGRQPKKKRQEQDGNLLSYPVEPNARNLGDIFTDRINDTNLNLQFFFEVGMPEMMSEWIPVRSKNLIKYEGAERINREIEYRKYWEYEYDSEDNLVGATVIRFVDVPLSKYKLKIEYVTE